MNGADVARVRAATAADLDAVVALERRAFARPWSAASLRDELARPDRVWLLAEDGGELVGYGGVADLAGDAHVLTVAVAPERRRRGHGLALVHGLLAAAHGQLGSRRATLEVRRSNVAARSLYRRCGFTEAGVRPGYYQDDGEGAVVLWCEDLAATLAALHATTDRRPHPQRRPEPPRDQEERP